MRQYVFPYLTKFSIVFYSIFSIISLLGYLIINYRHLHLLSILSITIFILAITLGTYIGNFIPHINIKKKIINPATIIKLILIISSISILIGWKYILDHYGSIAYVIANSFTIRTETIGNGLQLIPVVFTYGASLNVIVLPLSLVCYSEYKKKFYIAYAFISFCLTVLGDLQAFGRIGILFAIFNIICYIILYKIRIPKSKIIIYGFLIFGILMLPRYFRGGNSLEGMGYRYTPYLVFDYPSFLEPFITTYAYYFSGYYAHDYLLEQSSEYQFQYGERNFAAVINLANRIIPFKEERSIIIAEEAFVPFDTNIYTIIGELYMDGGLLAIILGSLCFGTFMGFLFNNKGIFGNALKIIILVWFFETPIYNVFSFGNFLLSFLLLIFLSIFFDGNSFNHNSKLQLR